ncbi:MAG: DUF4381 domain-containing protein [Pseudomonadota bacterium]
MNPDSLPLRDIHAPPPVGWWPLAPGWWVLAAVLVLALAVVGWRWYQRGQRLRAARQVLDSHWRNWQQHADARALLVGLSATLRRSAIAAFGRDATAGLVGRDWQAFLNEELADAPFASTPGTWLLDAAYRPEMPAMDSSSAAALRELVWHRIRTWLRPGETR